MLNFFRQKPEEQESRRDRKTDSFNRRVSAAKRASERPQAIHENNQEEQLPGLPGNFHKGLSHQNDGFLEDERDYQAYRGAILSGEPEELDSILTPNVEKRRKWESPSAGFVFDLEGPDAQAITMPPAPKLDSAELQAEMAEVYSMATLRDIPFSQFSSNTDVSGCITKLNQLSWFNGENRRVREEREYSLDEVFGIKIGKVYGRSRGPVTLDNLFRGITKGDDVGPYLSQFLLIGTPSRGADSTDKPTSACEWGIDAGKIAYGAQTIDQRVRVANFQDNNRPIDFMLKNDEWTDVQNGAGVQANYTFEYNQTKVTFPTNGDPNTLNGPAYRFITTPRDLATYVHFDQLYQAYLNACIIMLELKVPTDEGFARFSNGINQQGFAQFGGPHILSLVTEVATRALKAVRFQKFNIHNRARPEYLGGLMEQLRTGNSDCKLHPLKETWNVLRENDFLTNPKHFLPMAFPEGSPMHPSYGAGHATVAGACVTILKAFFKHDFCLSEVLSNFYEADPNQDGRTLAPIAKKLSLTVEGELNKLASNISIGRNMAGVHYFSDYIESLRLGELIALGILEEQALMYNSRQFPFSMTVPLFDGGHVVIGTARQ